MTGQTIKESIGLKWRLILVISLLLLVSSLSLTFVLLDELRSVAVKGLEQRGTSLTKNLAYNAELGVMVEMRSDLDNFITGILKEREILFAQIYTKDGTILSAGVRPGVDSSNIPRFTQERSLRSPNVDFQEGVFLQFCKLMDGIEIIEIVSPVTTVKSDISREELGTTAELRKSTDESRVTIGYARVGISLKETYQIVREARQMIIISTLALVALGILLSVMLVKMVSRPINTLIDATELIAAGNFSQRVGVTADRELARLAVAFNKMCDSLQQSQKEVDSYQLTLEQKIKERTRRLEEAQRQVIQAEKMAAVGQLAAGVAHELNNPLGGILGYAQFALEKIDNLQLEGNELEDYRRYLSDIEQQARRCKMIVKNLLKFSRSSNSTEFDSFDINAALEETFVFTAHQLEMKGVVLHKELAPNLPLVYGNSNLLQQVFTNIIVNSMQSMPEGGDLWVKTRFSPSVGEFGGAAEIIISDTGAGIPEEHLHKVFEPFFTTKKTGEGTGLGLSVSYGIVKEHGGEIKITSKVGEGSTFTVILPIVKETVKV